MKTRALESEGRYVLLGALAQGRRVLEIGCVDGRGLAALAEAGAEELTATTSMVPQLQSAMFELGVEGVEIRPDYSPPLGFADDAFDLVICHDFVDRLERNDEWRTEIRRILSPTGYLVVTVANRDGQFLSELGGLRGRSALDYEGAFGALASTFGKVGVYGQSPVVVSMFFDLQSEEEDPDLTFDGTLLEADGEDPGWYVLVFGPEPPRRDDLLLVRHDFGRAVKAIRGAATARPMPVVDPQELEALQARLAEAQREVEAAGGLRQQLEVLEQQLEALQQQKVELETLLQQKEGLQAQEAHDEDSASQAALQNAVLALRTVEQDLHTTRLRAHRAEEALDRALASAAAERETFAQRLAAAQKEAAQNDDHQEALAALQSKLNQTLELLRQENELLRRATERTKLAEENLSIERLASYRARNELQQAKDDFERATRELEKQLQSETQEHELTRSRLSEAHERQKEAERIAASNADQIAALQQSLQAAEQMFERTKAELVRIEEGSQQRIEENKQFTETLIEQSKLATQARFDEEIERLRSQHAEELEQARREAANDVRAQLQAEMQAHNERAASDLEAARQETQAHLQALERAAEQKLEEAKAAAQAQIDTVQDKVTEALAAREEAESRAQRLEEELGELQERVRGLSEAEEKLQALVAEREQGDRERQHMEQQVQALSSERDALQAQIQALQTQVQELTDGNQQLGELLAQSNRMQASEQERAANENAELRAQVSSVREERDAMAKEVQRLTDALAALQSDTQEPPDTGEADAVLLEPEFAEGATAQFDIAQLQKAVRMEEETAGRQDTVVDLDVLSLKTQPVAKRRETMPHPLDDAAKVTSPETDALGRGIEPSLEELEDLLQSPIPGTTERR